MADRSAFKEVFERFPQQNLALPLLSKRVRPDTPPPTPDRKSIIPTDIHEAMVIEPPLPQDQVNSSRFTPPVTPSPSQIILKLVIKQTQRVTKTKRIDCIKATPTTRNKKVRRSGLIV